MLKSRHVALNVMSFAACKQLIPVFWVSNVSCESGHRSSQSIMRNTSTALSVLFLLAVGSAGFGQTVQPQSPSAGVPAIWADPGNITAKNLLYGSGGPKG